MATQNIPVGVPSDGMVKLAFVPTIADLAAPKIATELKATTALSDIGCWLSTFGVGATEQTREIRRVCSKQTFEDFGTITRTVEDLMYVYDPQNPESETNEVYAGMKEGTRGFLVIAWGKDSEEDWAAGDVVDIYPVRLGAQRKQTPEQNGELMVAQKPYVTSTIAEDVALAA